MDEEQYLRIMEVATSATRTENLQKMSDKQLADFVALYCSRLDAFSALSDMLDELVRRWQGKQPPHMLISDDEFDWMQAMQRKEQWLRRLLKHTLCLGRAKRKQAMYFELALNNMVAGVEQFGWKPADIVREAKYYLSRFWEQE